MIYKNLDFRSKLIQKYGSSLFVLSMASLFFVMFSTSLAFAEINTDKLVYTKGEIVKISGTLDLQDDDEQVNIIEIEIIDSNNDVIVNAYTPVSDNEFSSSYDTITWIPGNYEITINYNDIEDYAEFEVVTSSSSSDDDDNDSNTSDNIIVKESENNPQDSSSSTTLSDTVPYSPIDLKANVISSTQIDFSWSLSDENDSSIIGFKIEVRTNTDPNYSVIVENTGNDDTFYSHTGLVPDTVYAYRVLAINSAGESEPSSSTTVKTLSNSTNSQNTNIEDTNVPTDLVARIISPTSVELRWTPPTQTYGQIINGYTIKQEITTGVFNEIANTVGSGTDYTVSNLDSDKSYTFVVVANYLRGSSDVSETTTVTMSSFYSTSNNNNDNDDNSNSVASTDVPNPPTDLKVNPVLSRQIDLSWSAPTKDSDDDNSITGYKIEVRTTNDSSYSAVIGDTESTDTTYSHTGLIPNTTYIYRVYAINDIGTSEPSDERLANTLITDPEEESISDSSSTQDDDSAIDDANTLSSSTDIPGQPVDLQVTPILQNRIDISWSAPIDSGLSPLLGYKIESKTSEQSDYSILVTNTGNPSNTSYSHTGLTAGLTYQYRVSAINSFGESMPSDMVEATIVSSSDNVPVTDETQSQQLSTASQPLQVTLSADKAVYGHDDFIEISGTINNSDQTVPLGLRVVSSDDTIVYATSISISNDNSFEVIISPLQRQSSAWQTGGEFTVEVTYNDRIQTTTTFMNDSNDDTGNSLPTSNESSNNNVIESNEQKSTQSSSKTSSTNDLIILNNELESLKNQNTLLESANQQLQDESNLLKTQIEDLNKKIENLDMVVQEQIRVMAEVLGLS